MVPRGIFSYFFFLNEFHIQGAPKRSRYKNVHSFVNKAYISKIFYTVVVLLSLIHNMTSNLVGVLH